MQISPSTPRKLWRDKWKLISLHSVEKRFSLRFLVGSFAGEIVQKFQTKLLLNDVMQISH